MKFYITFGYGHRHLIGNKIFDENCIGIVEAKNKNEAREIAFSIFGRKWCTCYLPKDLDEKLFSRGHIEISLDPRVFI